MYFSSKRCFSSTPYLFVVPLRIAHEDHGQCRRRRLVRLDEGHVARLEEWGHRGEKKKYTEEYTEEGWASLIKQGCAAVIVLSYSVPVDHRPL